MDSDKDMSDSMSVSDNMDLFDEFEHSITEFKQIEEIHTQIIKKLESYEKKFKSSVEIENYNGVVEASRKQLVEYEKCLSLFSVENEKRAEKYNECERVIKDLQQSVIEVKNKLFSNLSITYEPMEKNGKDLFGKLIIKVSLFIF